MFDRFRYHHEVRPDFLPDQTKRRQGNVRAFGTRGWVVARRVHSPPFSRGVAATLIKRSRSLAAQTEWLVISNKIRIATRAYKEATRLFTNHPRPLRGLPSFERRGMDLAPPSVMDFDIACLRQSPEIQRLSQHFLPLFPLFR